MENCAEPRSPPDYIQMVSVKVRRRWRFSDRLMCQLDDCLRSATKEAPVLWVGLGVQGGAAEHIAGQLEGRIRVALRGRNSLFHGAASPGLASSMNRPLLCLFDRNFELSVVSHPYPQTSGLPLSLASFTSFSSLHWLISWTNQISAKTKADLGRHEDLVWGSREAENIGNLLVKCARS